MNITLIFQLDEYRNRDGEVLRGSGFAIEYPLTEDAAAQFIAERMFWREDNPRDEWECTILIDGRKARDDDSPSGAEDIVARIEASAARLLQEGLERRRAEKEQKREMARQLQADRDKIVAKKKEEAELAEFARLKAKYGK